VAVDHSLTIPLQCEQKRIDEPLVHCRLGSEVAEVENERFARASLYHEVWDVLYKLQGGAFEAQTARGASQASSTPVTPRTAYGGVLFNAKGQVLLVEPANHHDNTVWTWPKGKPDPGEKSAEAVALREVLEETGYHAEIVAPIQGSWPGVTGKTEYFLMRPVGSQGPLCNEVACAKWINPDDAPDFIQQTSKSSARKRDLEVLAAAMEAIRKLSTEKDTRSS
jgi:8-oxo-dGTP diphosphatase